MNEYIGFLNFADIFSLLKTSNTDSHHEAR